MNLFFVIIKMNTKSNSHESKSSKQISEDIQIENKSETFEDDFHGKS